MTQRFTKTPGGGYLAATAVVIGDVTAGPDCSFWFGSVIRGDVAPVRLGRRVNVQDNAVLHCDTGEPNEIGDDVTIGHGAIVHGLAVGRGSLIGMGAVVLGKSRLGEQCLVAAGAVVPPGLVVPDRMAVLGVPGKIVRPVKDSELAYMAWLTTHYVELAGRYAAGAFGPSPEI